MYITIQRSFLTKRNVHVITTLRYHKLHVEKSLFINNVVSFGLIYYGAGFILDFLHNIRYILC